MFNVAGEVCGIDQFSKSLTDSQSVSPLVTVSWSLLVSELSNAVRPDVHDVSVSVAHRDA